MHHETPPAARVPGEMEHFLGWLEEPRKTVLLLIAWLAHLRFVPIHPF